MMYRGLMLKARGNVERAIVVSCPVCHEAPGRPCVIEEGVPFVHDLRESRGYQAGVRQKRAS